MAKPWRELELLVKRVESVLAPKGAKVTSPDELPDRNTGQPREVDVTIRMPIGSATILIAIECRKRQDEQDVTWIEQVAGKQQSIGADKMIAVSASDFTEPAKLSAKAKGIELRVIETLTDEDVASWVSTLDVSLFALMAEPRGVTFDANVPAVPRTDKNSDMKVWNIIKKTFVQAVKKPQRTPIIHHAASKRSLTLRDLLQLALPHPSNWPAGLSAACDPTEHTVTIDPPGFGWTVAGTQTDVFVSRVHVRAMLTVREIKLQFSEFSRYSTSEKPLLLAAEARVKIEGMPGVVVTVVRKVE